MENKDQNTLSLEGAGGSHMSPNGGLHEPPPLNPLPLEQDPRPLTLQRQLAQKGVHKFGRVLLRPYTMLAVLLLMVSAVIFAVVQQESQNRSDTESLSANRFNSIKIPLDELLSGRDLSLAGAANVTINGILQAKDGLLLSPSLQPTGARPGQLYYDQTLNQLAYYNGGSFVFLTGPPAGGVQSLGGATGQLVLGEGLTLTSNQLSNGGVLSVQGQQGAVSFTAGAGIVINGTNFSNSGVISVASATPNLSVSDDGNGNVTLTMAGGTAVTSSGGAGGAIPLFTAAQNIEDSIISQAGLLVTVAGDLSVTGSLNLGTALAVSEGGTGSGTHTANGVLVGNGASAISSVTAGGVGLCLVSTAGAPTWSVCPGDGGVSSLDGLTGALTIANTSGAGSTITIDDASTAAKGIASFNGTNFTVTSGAVNTVQDINASATPTFAGVNTNSINPSAALAIGAVSQSLLLQGNASTTLTANNGGNVTTVSFQSPTANVTYRFLTAPAGTYDICTTAANCAGVGGGVTTSGGTTNRLSKFSGAQSITDSSITDDGTNVLTSIDMVIQGGDLTVGVPTSQMGTINLAHNGSAFLGSILQGALSANRTYTLPDASGTFCLTSGNCTGGVTSLNGLVGALNIANATAAGSTITINDASTSAKGIASFNSANFSVSTGAVNTIQDINTNATPTFVGVNANNFTPSSAMTIGATTQTALLRGSVATITSTGAGNDIILTSADTIELQGVTNVTGNIDISGTLSAGAGNAFQVAAGGTITTAGNVIAQGGTITAGTSSQAGAYVISDGSGNTGTLQVTALGQDTVYTLPDPGGASATICLTSGNCAGSGGGVTTAGGSTNRLAKFNGAQSIADSTITDDGTAVTTTVDLVIQGGSITVGTSSQLASLILHDGNGQTTILQAGDSSGGLTFILPTNAGTANQCLKQSGVGNQLVWDACDGGGGGSSATLQAAYNNGNSLTTIDARDIDIVLADTTTDSNFDLIVADGSTSYVSFTRTNGSGTADPAQLLLIDNLDTNRALPVGIKLQAAGGGMTAAIDATDAEIVDAINVAANNIVGTTGNIDFTNFDVIGASGNTSVGGTLNVANVTTLNSDLIANGNTAIGNDVADTLTITATVQGGSPLVFEGATADGNELTLNIATLTADRSITLPNEDGTICLQGSTTCGFAAASGSSNYIQNTTILQTNANIAIQSASDAGVTMLLKNRATQSADILRVVQSNDSVVLKVDTFGNSQFSGSAEFQSYAGFGTAGAATNGVTLRVYTAQDANVGLMINGNTGQTGDLIQVSSAGATGIFTIGATGSVLSKNAANSTTAFRVQNAAGSTTVLDVDTTNARVGVGTAAPTEALDVNGNVNIPSTTATVGIIKQNGARLMHTKGDDATSSFYAGINAGNLTNTGYWNVGVGESALQAVTTGFGNVAVGNDALQANTTGIYNTGVGLQSLTANVDGYYNSAFGMRTLISNTSGFYNTAVGNDALYANTTGSTNTAVGVNALTANISATNNAAFGVNTLESTTTGSFNTGLGTQALQENITGVANTAIGNAALYLNTDGNNNVAMGYLAGVTGTSANANTTGSNNVFIGFESGPATTTQRSNSTAIGFRSVVNQNDSLVLGCISGTNGCPASTKVGISNTAPGYLLHVGDANVTSGTAVARFQNAGGHCTITPNLTSITCTSDERLKKNIQGFSGALGIINQIDVKQYNMLADADGAQKQIGFLAQQVEKVLPSLVTTDENGYKSLSYAGMTPVLLQAIKEQQQQIDELRKAVDGQGGSLSVAGSTSVVSPMAAQPGWPVSKDLVLIAAVLLIILAISMRNNRRLRRLTAKV